MSFARAGAVRNSLSARRWLLCQALSPSQPGPSRLPFGASLDVQPIHLQQIHAATRIFHASTRSHKKKRITNEASPKDKGSKEFSHTLQLPNTPFGIRANAAQRDKLFYDRTCGELYQWQRARSDASGEFVFHDGPPYANGNLHCGHALNKILKDITNRYQVLRGKRVHYMPGWDCHGLPIEAKALASMSADQRHALDPREIRKRAHDEAVKAIETQKSEFSQFGIMADWSNDATYRTLDPGYEARQLRVFGEMVRKGLIYRQYRPVYWSPSNRTALAESELEYREDHLSKAVYVAFKLTAGSKLLRKLGENTAVAQDLHAIIWTTTPWSLPSNMAINVNPDLDYSIVRRSGSEGHFYIVGNDRVEALESLPSSLSDEQGAESTQKLGPLEEIVRIRGTDLSDSVYRSPLSAPNSSARPILMADYVTALSGTGLVHSAPAHGAEDYQIWKQQGRLQRDGIYSPVNDEGRYSSDILQLDQSSADDGSSNEQGLGHRLVGKEVLGEGAQEVMAILKERGALVSAQTLRHKYPYDWRSKQPVIVRATAQWFANLDDIKQQAIQALDDVTFVPANSRARLESFILGRSEWCISRQRVWGVPIPVLYDAATDEPLMTVENIEHIASVLEKQGTDYWWKADAEVFVAPQYREEGRTWRKGEDTVDVWFDSGTSWATLKDQLALESNADPSSRQNGIADVYLEGSDQHRGWFQSSLITAVATTPEGQKPVAPYKTVVTHGYVLDNESRKMSKSLGNVVSPLSIIQGGKGADEPAYGIDVLRLWVARSDFTTDPPIGNVIIHKTAETLRKLRNTARFMLANVPASGQVATLDKSKMRLLDRFVMQELYQLERACAASYEAYDFAQVVRRLTEFTNGTLSNLYLDVGKDSLYLDLLDNERRRMMVAVIDQILRTMTGIMAPIVPFLCEEVFHFRNGASSDPAEGTVGSPSVFSAGWPEVDECWNDEHAATDCKQLLKLRDASLVMIEEARQASHIKTSFEVEIDLVLQQSGTQLASLLQSYGDELTELFNVAKVNVVGQDLEEHASNGVLSTRDVEEGVAIRVRHSPRHKCPRCRTLRKQAEADRLCQRCQAVVDALAA
ncbi:probable ISM1-isoleucine--tRNA ligase, mitochondrial [Sporisorium reilianum SRZ2]|uniref:Isoleucine--tRNA ligase, mitochondrial n=1 Tax=Sporisorium reilianum (strain SRZ2) TaxID=999809 RepID=E7A043_SPORE|nr:probable ISM1-isoleucine--tRNA ligase, mitochondrial [Sporisorium reilianum SRZ2]